MKKIIYSGLIAGLILLIISFLMLQVLIRLLPGLAEEYYNPAFRAGSGRSLFFYLHPFLIGFALSWFWDMLKSRFTGNGWSRGLKMGLLYGAVATLPSMWITFSAIDLSLMMVLSWLVYGIFQAVAAGLVLARFNP